MFIEQHTKSSFKSEGDCWLCSLKYYNLFDNNSESWKFVCKLGFILGHSVLYLLATLLSRVLYVESQVTDKTSNNVQRGLPFRINSMIDLDTYYVPIFIHCSICEFMYMFLLVVIDVLYLTVVEYCCGLFAALRWA